MKSQHENKMQSSLDHFNKMASEAENTLSEAEKIFQKNIDLVKDDRLKAEMKRIFQGLKNGTIQPIEAIKLAKKWQ